MSGILLDAYRTLSLSFSNIELSLNIFESPEHLLESRIIVRGERKELIQFKRDIELEIDESKDDCFLCHEYRNFRDLYTKDHMENVYHTIRFWNSYGLRIKMIERSNELCIFAMK